MILLDLLCYGRRRKPLLSETWQFHSALNNELSNNKWALIKTIINIERAFVIFSPTLIFCNCLHLGLRFQKAGSTRRGIPLTAVALGSEINGKQLK